MELHGMSEETSTAVAIQKLEGKIDRVLDATQRQADDLKFVREIQEKQRDELAKLSGLNIQERFVSQGQDYVLLDNRVKVLELAGANVTGVTKGVELSAKVVYACIAIGGIGFAAMVIRILTGG